MNIFKKYRFLKFISSVKLAVPLMITMTVVVAAGTIIESKYNADMAKLLVYQSRWFLVILALLFINILCATLSRWPFKEHHTGFVVTHIGLLTLLTGSMITSVSGIDGQLRVEERGKSNEVVLPDLSFELINRETGEVTVIPLDRSLSKLEFDDFSSANKTLGGMASIVSYIPFAKAERVFEKSADGKSNGPVAVEFGLKSGFFDVKEWLHSEQNPKFQMGPASLALVVHSQNEKSPRAPQAVAPSRGQARLSILDFKSKNLIKEVTLADLKSGVTVGGVKIKLLRVYEQATVGGKNKLEEGGQPGANPALELSVEHQGKTLREVAYAKFPEFTMQPQGFFGYTFKFTGGAQPEATSASQQEMPQDEIHSKMAGGRSGGNLIEFHIYDEKPDQVLVRLSKNGKKELEQWTKAGDVVQTPWMGMKITVMQIVRGGVESQRVSPTEPMPGTELPSSALQVKIPGSQEGVWMLEGDAKDITVDSHPYQIYYGRKIIRLPFEIVLEKFSKVDYPGTQTPMSFESLVKVNNADPLIKISMNEPLNQSGYTLYQSSYIMQPGMPVYSIFSVNLDPGRTLKYVGSLILVVGIIVFTLMRSRLAKPARRTNG